MKRKNPPPPLFLSSKSKNKRMFWLSGSSSPVPRWSQPNAARSARERGKRGENVLFCVVVWRVPPRKKERRRRKRSRQNGGEEEEEVVVEAGAELMKRSNWEG